MASIKDLYQSADWKFEKHVPVLDFMSPTKQGEYSKITITIGKEIPHPNTTAHHIQWVSLYFQPRGSKHPLQIGVQEFSSHGSSIDGPDTSTVYTHSQATFTFKTDKPGILFASSYCNIHGLWESSKEIEIGQN